MSKEEKGLAESLGDVLNRVLSPILDRLERLENKGKAEEITPIDSPDELHEKLMASLRGQDQDLEPFHLIEVHQGCLSDTGATFDAEVHYPALRKGGKIVGRDAKRGLVKVLSNYTWPEGVDKHVSQGGLVPDGMEMKELSGQWIGQETDAYRQWKYEEFYKADNKRYVGKPLPAHIQRVAVAQPAKSA